ncbi:MAG: hypothetical protein Q4A16_01620 [Lautropia sp.]|nr:hypothetical protein [Lautropia sp.]
MRRFREDTFKVGRPRARYALGSALLMAASIWSQPTQATLSRAEIKLLKDGLGNFDSTAGAGMDTGDQNGIVRTHDQLEYQISLSTNQGAQAPRMELTLPRRPNGEAVARWMSVPTKCISGSISADGQQLSCTLADFPAGRTEATNFHAYILGSAPNGTQVPAPTIRVGTAGTAEVPIIGTIPTVQVSAAPFYDVVLMKGNPVDASYQLAGGPQGQSSMYVRPFLGLMARHPNGWGKLGIEQLDPNQPIRIDLSLSGFPGQTRTDGNHPQLVNWLPITNSSFSFTDGCGNSAQGSPDRRQLGGNINNYGLVLDHGPGGVPSGLAARDAVSAVHNGGDCVVTGSQKDSISLELVGVDTTLVNPPSVFFRTGRIPVAEQWVAGKVLVLWSDVDDYTPNQAVFPELRIQRVTGTSVSGAPMQNVRTDNDMVSLKFLVTTSGTSSKIYNPDSTLPRPYSTFPDMLAHTGRVDQMAPDQSTGALIRYQNSGATTHRSLLLCEVIDRTAFDLAPHFSAYLSPSASYPIASRRIRYGAHVSGNRFFASTDSAIDAHTERSAGDSAYATASCDGPEIRWFDTARAAEAAGGLVYVRAEMDELHGGHSANLVINGLVMRRTWGATITVESPYTEVRRAGEPIAPGSIIRNRAVISTPSLPDLDVSKNQDHLEVVEMQTVSRLTKEITDPPNAQDARVAAGTVISYRLSPRFSTTFPPQARTVTITDVLPANVHYVSGSGRAGGDTVEPVIQRDQPAKDMTTLIWRFENRMPHAGENSDDGAALPVITYQARLSLQLTDDTVVQNHASISGGGNDYERDCVFNPTQQAYVNCNKSASARLIVQSPPGFQLEKNALPTEIEPGDPFVYTLTFISMGQEIRAPHIPELIDILPFDGDGQSIPANNLSARQPPSRFGPGAYRLQAVVPADIDPDAGIYYTNRRPTEINNDPQHGSNQIPGGGTRWCLAREFGSAGCPAGIADSTAVRIRPALRTLPRNTPYEVRLELISDPVLAQPGDIFANRTGSRPSTADSALQYVESQANLNVRVVAAAVGSLSGRLFVDTDQDNVFDPEDRALSDQCVVLHGTRRSPDDVLASTRTDASGHFSFAAGLRQRIYASANCSGSPLDNFAGLLAGEYSLHKLGTSTGHRSGASHAGTLGGTPGQDRIEAIRLPAGENGTGYHLTEVPVPPVLTLTATLNNDQGGSASLADALLGAVLEGSSTPALSGSSGTSGVDRITVPSGRYLLSASVLPGYRSSPWQCTVDGQSRALVGTTDSPAIELNHGEQAVCSLHYHDRPGRLTLVKALDLRHGRTAAVTDFVLHAEGQDQNTAHRISGRSGTAAVTAVELPAGRYVLREDEYPGFLPKAWICRDTDDATRTVDLDGNTLRLNNGQDVSCTLTNTDTPRLSFDQVDTDGQVTHSDQPNINPLPELPPVVVYVSSIDDPGRQVTLTLDHGTMELAIGNRYRLSTSETPGYDTKLLCRRADGELATPPFSFRNGNISCSVQRKRIPATMTVTKVVSSEPQLLANTLNEYTLTYLVTVTHTGGADTLYDLADVPAFDPDVQIIAQSASRNGNPLDTLPGAGRWTLADRHPLAMGATDTYRLQFRVRVPFGGDTQNDSCTAGAASAGSGLFNRVTVINRQDDSDVGANSTHGAQACTDTPLPVSRAQLVIEKSSTVRSAEVGDLITYRLRIRNTGEGPALWPVIVDRLPRGFGFDAGSVRVQGARQLAVQFSGQRELRLKIDRVESAAGTLGSTLSSGTGEVIISYRARLGVGSQEGDGINRAHVECPRSMRAGNPAAGVAATSAGTHNRCSNESRWKVQVEGGVFSEEACLAGQIFVDCNGNSIKDPEELGIPGVRLYLQNGTWIVSDEHGKFSHCGLRPRTHVLKVDARTLPRRSRLVTSSAQNVGDAHSLFIDARKGMLHRADFIEGSCSPAVVEQVKARQAQGANTSVQTEGRQPALSFESKAGPSGRPLHEGTDGARQSIARRRH